LKVSIEPNDCLAVSRSRFGLTSVKMFRADFGPEYKRFFVKMDTFVTIYCWSNRAD